MVVQQFSSCNDPFDDKDENENFSTAFVIGKALLLLPLSLKMLQLLQVLQLQQSVFSTIRQFRLPLRGKMATATCHRHSLRSKTKLAKFAIVVKVAAAYAKFGDCVKRWS
jgi:hypothetical protein